MAFFFGLRCQQIRSRDRATIRRWRYNAETQARLARLCGPESLNPRLIRPIVATIAPAGITMPRYLRVMLIGMTGMMAAHAFADQLEEHDPVRVAQRLKDCVAQNLALHDGRTRTAIRQTCKKAIAEGSYKDPNISLDGMVKSPPQQ